MLWRISSTPNAEASVSHPRRAFNPRNRPGFHGSVIGVAASQNALEQSFNASNAQCLRRISNAVPLMHGDRLEKDGIFGLLYCLTIVPQVDLIQPPKPETGWHGSLQLTYARCNTTTHLTHSQVQAPLKVQRPFYPEGEAVCHSVMLHTAGGFVGGDRLSFAIHLQPQAQVLITTAAAAKIYRTNGLEAQQTGQIDVAEGACLEWLPQETIVFDRALYRQALRINLAPGALWFGWELMRFGRSARGEKFTEGDWRSHTEVWQAGKPLWIDRQWLPGSEATFHSPHGLAGCPVVGSLALVGYPVEPELVAQVRSLWSGTSGETGVTRLQAGLLCRYRGTSTAEARQWFLAVWQQLRPLYGQRPVCIPRVWQMEQQH